MDYLSHIFAESKAKELPAPTLDNLRLILDRLDDWTVAEVAAGRPVPAELDACLNQLTDWYRAALRAEGPPPPPPRNSLRAALANLAPSLTDRRPA